MAKPKGTTEEQKEEIRRFVAEGHTYDEASAGFGLAKSTISEIVKQEKNPPLSRGQAPPAKPAASPPPDYPLVNIPTSVSRDGHPQPQKHQVDYDRRIPFAA